VTAQEAEHRQRPMRTDLPHACGGRLSGCGPACCVLHAGFGRDAAWVVAGWGKGRMRRTLLGRWQVGAEAARGKAALGGCRWGQRQHKSIGMPLTIKTNLEHSNPQHVH
jgi:hypothetical protein